MNMQLELLKLKDLILTKERLVVSMTADLTKYGEFRMDYHTVIDELDAELQKQYQLLNAETNNQTESKPDERPAK